MSLGMTLKLVSTGSKSRFGPARVELIATSSNKAGDNVPHTGSKAGLTCSPDTGGRG